MNIFDPKTHMIIDVTSPTPKMVNYHFGIKDPPENYDKFGKQMYQVAPDQVEIGKVPFDIMRPETVKLITNEITNNDDFHEGFSHGLCDGLVNCREYFREERFVSWSFLIGYEYGILLKSYGS